MLREFLSTDFEQGNHWQDWKVGKHGVRIVLKKDRVYSATYLPEVAENQGWNHKETMESLLRKAGCRHIYSFRTLLQEIHLIRYQSSKYPSYFSRLLCKINSLFVSFSTRESFWFSLESKMTLPPTQIRDH